MFSKKAIASVLAGLVMGLGFVEVASATTVLTTAMDAALTAGFTNLQDTAGDIVAKVWPYMLGIMALYAAPKIVKKLWNMAAGG